MRKRIAVLVTHDFEDSEYAEPVEAFRAARHCISNIEHRAGNIVYGKNRTYAVTIDQSIDHASIHDFDALLIPGGIMSCWTLPTTTGWSAGARPC